jgi:hypothetical protein
MKTRRSIPLLLALLSFVPAVAGFLHADGIPEPGILLYGNVTNANRLLRSGSLTVEFSGPSGKVVRVTTQLIASGAYAYRLRVPFESVVGGNVAASEAYALEGKTVTVRLSAPAAYNTASAVSFPAAFSLSAAEINLPAGERGIVREINFNVAGSVPTSGPIRLAEARIPTAEAGNGSGPAEPVFQFTTIAATQEPGVLVEWSGAPVNQGYYLLRATDMNATPEQSEVVRYFPASPQTVNTFWDTNTVDTTTYFYRLLVP